MELSSSNSAVVVPGSVMVPAGASSAVFTAGISAVTSPQTAVLTASAGGGTESYTFQLVPPTPGLTLEPTSLPFDDVSLNTTGTRTIFLTSSGTAPLTISAAAVTGTGFSLAGASFPVTLQPGQTAMLDVQFDPTATGAVSGAVTLTTNSSQGLTEIALTGTGVMAGAYEVDLTWNPPTDSADPVAGYEIYRAVSGSSNYQLLNWDMSSDTTYADTTVQSGTSYTYYVVSVDAVDNQSAPSNLFGVNIP